MAEGGHYGTRLALTAIVGTGYCVAPFVSGLSRFDVMYAIISATAVGLAAMHARAGRRGTSHGWIPLVGVWLSMAAFAAVESAAYFSAGFDDDDPVIPLDALLVVVFGLSALIASGVRACDGHG